LDQPIGAAEPAAQQHAEPAPSLIQIFLGFAKAGLSSIGGGVSGWMMREFVQNRGWIGEQEFLTGLALAQAFPGVNVVNLSIWIGFRLRRGPGALVATLGMICPPLVVALVLLAVFEQVAQYPIVGKSLAGAAAVAIGLSLAMGVKAVQTSAVRIAPIVVIIATIVAIFVMQWPLLPVIAVIAPVSIGLAYLRLRSGGKAP
jgi:chromate transporter